MLFESLSEMEEMVPGYGCFSLSCGSGIRCSIPTVDHGNKGVFSCGKKFNGPNAKAKLRRSKLSYSRVRELVKEAFKDCIDSTLIGVHSLRAGDASAAANNGIPDRLFKRHGRWLSEKAKDGYVKDDLKERLSVTRSLEI